MQWNHLHSLCVCLLTLAAQAHCQEPAKQPPTARAGKARVTVSQQTTVLTAPLRPDGYVDYIGAMNQQASEGVTAENNAAVLFFQAWGPECLGGVDPERFYELLGIDPLPMEGKVFVPSTDYIQTLSRKQEKELFGGNEGEESPKEKLEKAFGEAMERPWSKDEFPEVARWLRLNREPLDLVCRGSQRPRYYIPLLAAGPQDEALLLHVEILALNGLRATAHGLSTRAMLRLQQGKHDEAWSDLHACHRMSRLVGLGPTLVDMLVGIAINHIAFNADVHLIGSEKLTAELAQSILADLQALEPFPDLISRINQAERFMALDSIAGIASGRTDIGQVLNGEPTPALLNRIGSVVIDWDLILRNGNQWFDKMIATLDKPTYGEQKAALDSLMEEHEALGKKFNAPGRWLGSLLAGPADLSRSIGDILILLLLTPASPAHEAHYRAITLSRLELLGFALAAYRTEQGKYPRQLEQLAPKYLPAPPADPFTDQPFRYQRKKNGFLLYSLGPNQKDDGGKLWYLDQKESTSRQADQPDDYRLRVSSP